MNRTQAEHLLSAYLKMARKRKNEESAEALKDVILDAMCYGGYITAVPYYQYRYPSWNPSWTWTSATGTTIGDITAKPGTTTTISGNGSL